MWAGGSWASSAWASQWQSGVIPPTPDTPGITFGSDVSPYASFGEVTSAASGIVDGGISEAGTTFGEAY